MKLEKIFVKLNDSCKVYVISYYTKKVLAIYDGKESITKSYNYHHLLEINVKEDALELYV